MKCKYIATVECPKGDAAKPTACTCGAFEDAIADGTKKDAENKRKLILAEVARDEAYALLRDARKTLDEHLLYGCGYDGKRVHTLHYMADVREKEATLLRKQEEVDQTIYMIRKERGAQL